MAFQLRRGTEAERTAAGFVPAEAEPIYITDTGRLYIGDGSTPGGVEYKTVEGLDEVTGVTLSKDIVRSISQYSVTSDVVTVTLIAAHDYTVGNSVTISNSTVSAIDGTHLITAVSDSFSFSFALTLADVSPTAITANVARELEDGEVLTYNATGDYWTNASAVTSLQFLEDVNLVGVTLTDGMFLRYSDTLNAWTAQSVDLDYSLDELTDVTLTSVSSGQVLSYDGTSSAWVNTTLTIPTTTAGLTDVTSTTPTNNQFLKYSTTGNAYSPHTLVFNDLSEVNILGATNGQYLFFNGSSWDAGDLQVDAVEKLADTFYYNARDENLPYSTDVFAAAAGPLDSGVYEKSITPEYEPTAIVFDLYEGTATNRTSRSGFSRFTPTNGTATQANGYLYAVPGQTGTSWARSTATSSPLSDISGTEIWFEADIKYDALASRGSFATRILDLRGTIGLSSTEVSLLGLVDNYWGDGAEKSLLTLDSYLQPIPVGEDIPPSRPGDAWYRVCVVFDFVSGAYSIWVGEIGYDSELTQVGSGFASTEISGNEWNIDDFGIVNLRKVVIFGGVNDDYYVDNVHVGVGRSRYAWQPAETTIPFERTFGARPRHGVVEKGSVGNLDFNYVFTDLIDDGDTWEDILDMGQAGFLRKITTSAACRVRLYISEAAFIADSARPYATPPASNIGLIFDHEFASASSLVLTPCVVYALASAETNEKLFVYAEVENQSGTTEYLDTYFEYTQLEYNLF